jgi:hypothetical protein
MQNDGHHLPIVDQHRVFTNLLKILEIWIMSLVFLWRWGRDAHAYYLMHGVRDTMPSSTKMSNNGSTFLSPMLGEAQFCVPNNNPYQIMRSTFTIELKKEKNLELDNTRLSSGGPYHSGGGSSIVTRLPNGSPATSNAYWSLIAKGLGSYTYNLCTTSCSAWGWRLFDQEKGLVV